MVIGNRTYRFLLRHRVSYSGSPHVVRLKCEDQSRSQSHGRVSTRELCSRPLHIQRVLYVDSVVGGSTFCGFAASRLMLRLTSAFAFWVRVDDLHVIFLGSVGPSFGLYMFRLHFAFIPWLNDIQQNFGGYKIWRELNLVGIKFGWN